MPVPPEQVTKACRAKDERIAAIRERHDWSPDLTAYAPFDQEQHLGKPPWTDDERRHTWERAHGHDVRLKCYPEFGCLVIQEEADRDISFLLDALDAAHAENERLREERKGLYTASQAADYQTSEAELVSQPLRRQIDVANAALERARALVKTLSDSSNGTYESAQEEGDPERAQRFFGKHIAYGKSAVALLRAIDSDGEEEA